MNEKDRKSESCSFGEPQRSAHTHDIMSAVFHLIVDEFRCCCCYFSPFFSFFLSLLDILYLYMVLSIVISTIFPWENTYVVCEHTHAHRMKREMWIAMTSLLSWFQWIGVYLWYERLVRAAFFHCVALALITLSWLISQFILRWI